MPKIQKWTMNDEQRRLAEENVRLAYYFANQWYGKLKNYYSFEDVYDASMDALLQASKLYRDDQGTKFSTYMGNAVTMHMVKLIRKSKAHKRRGVTLSLDTPVTEDGKTTVEDTVGAEDRMNFVENDFITGALQVLSERERTFIIQSYLEGRNQSDIAKGAKITQVSVSRTIKRGLEKMKRYAVSVGS